MEINGLEPIFNTGGARDCSNMFEFNARNYIEMSHQLGLLLGSLSERKFDPELTGNALRKLLSESSRLGLSSTQAHLWNMIREVVKDNPGKVKLAEDGSGILLNDALIDTGRICHHIEAVSATLQAEIGSMLFKVIARERNMYADSSWLNGSQLESNFPTSFREFDRAGMCYALGQPTASVFHSMRALEPGLAALAAPFNISANHENWQNIINEIESRIRALGQLPKSSQKIENEKFFGGAVSHLYFVKNAWRNHVAHTHDSYSDDEALRVLHHSRDFIESLCGRLQE
jgi:hypothetical protein